MANTWCRIFLFCMMIGTAFASGGWHPSYRHKGFSSSWGQNSFYPYSSGGYHSGQYNHPYGGGYGGGQDEVLLVQDNSRGSSGFLGGLGGGGSLVGVLGSLLLLSILCKYIQKYIHLLTSLNTLEKVL